MIVLRLGQAARAILAAGHLAFGRLDHADAVVVQLLRCCAAVAACCHMRTFIAGATTTGLSVASSKVVARSSAMPAAIFASRSAVAGQTSTKSAARLKLDMADLDFVLELPQRSVDLAFGQRAEAHRSDEMLAAFGQHRRDPWPAFLSRRTSSSDLYAAIPPPTMRRTWAMARDLARRRPLPPSRPR